MTEFLSLKDYVYNYISEEIGKGNLKEDEKVNENVICEELNISRTPVREALIQLATEGYLENIPRKGFVIRKLDENEAKEIYTIVGLLDGYAAKSVCNDLTDKDFKDMEFYIGSMDLAIKGDNYEMYMKQQNDFHDTYINKCENSNLVILIHQLRKKFLRKLYVLPEGGSIKDILLDTNAEHKEILKLLKKRDCDGVEKYIREVHWEPSKAYMETIE